MSDFASTAREYGLARTAASAGLAGALLLALGESWQTAAVVVAAATLAALASEYADRRRVRASARGLVLGALLGASAVAWYVTTARVVGPAVALAVSGWLVLDGAVARRPYDAPQPERELADRLGGMGFRERVGTFRDVGEVGRELGDSPATPVELAARVEMLKDEVREHLSLLRAANLVERDGETHRRAERERGVRTWPRRAASRVLRPFRVLAR